jgi:type IV pilus assembly protein PilQ
MARPAPPAQGGKTMNQISTIYKTARTCVWIFALSVAAALAVWPQSRALAADNSIESINVVGQQSGNIVVRISLKQPLTNPPAGFTINNPPRIAFDFPGTSNALG